MAEAKSLEELRREVDAIDDALHDLLMRRATITDAIAKTKPRVDGRIPLARAMRPAREAEIMRRAIARHSGSLPVETAIRVIREVLAASLRAQTPFRVHVFDDRACVDLAHEYFGAGTRLTRHADVAAVVDSCTADADAIGVVPYPPTPRDLWWTQLASDGGPRVIAKLPFADDGVRDHWACAIAAIAQEPSGDDTTVLVADLGSHTGGFIARFEGAGIRARTVTIRGGHALMETDGFLASDDPRFAACGLRAIGGFANPVTIKTKELAQ